MQLALKNWLWRKQCTTFSLKTDDLCMIDILVHTFILSEHLIA